MTLRVGFLGAGLIAGLHAFQVMDCATPARIVAVHDPDDDRAAEFAKWTDAVVKDSPAEVVADSDVVFICTWTSEHEPMLELVADAGRAVFLEKPVATDLATARAMADVVESAGIPNTVGLVLRSSPALLTMKHLIEHPDTGRIMNIVFRDDQYIPTQGVYASTWRADRSKAGSGVLLEHSIHDLDILEWLCGPISSVSAHTSYFHGLDGIEDSVSMVARFGAGHTATLSSIWHDVLSRPSQRHMEVFTERSYTALEGDFLGPIRWTRQGVNGSDRAADAGSGGETAEPDPVNVIEGEPMVGWLAEQGTELVSAEERFLSSVANGSGDGGPTIREALRAHVLVDAVYRSAEAGGAPVDVSG